MLKKGDNILDKVSSKRNIFLFFSLLMFLVIAMRDAIAGVINTVWVNPVMSNIYDGADWYAIIFSIILTLYYVLCYRNEKHYSSVRFGLLLAVAFVYVLSLIYSSINGQGWIYKSIYGKDCCLLYYSTLIFVIPIVGEVALLIKRKKNDKKKVRECSLIYERPISSQNEDSYKRNNYGNLIASKLKNNFHQEGSFVIGISGEWGSGKTSFLNLIDENINDKEVDIKIWFKPWLSSTKDNIVVDFLSQLSKELSVFIPNVDNKLRRYAELVSDISSEPLLNNSFKLLQWKMHESAGNRYKEIKDIIYKSRLKIIIYIDDIDRLMASEVIEVFRLVRNVADFSYMQFIIPYDRKYIVESLEKEIPSPENYMQKIFNLEIVLPAYESEVVRVSLKEQLIHHVKRNDIDIRPILRFLESYGDKFPVESLIKTKRDVIRLINSFIVNIETVYSSANLRSTQDIEIDILDFFKIELIRYGFPDYYYRLMHEPLNVLKMSGNSYVYDKSNSEVEGSVTQNDETHSNSKGNCVKAKDVLDVCMENLFPKVVVKSKDSISKLRAFDQYFRYRLDERNISQSEIIQLLKISDETELLQVTEDYFRLKNKGEVHNMCVHIVEKHNEDSWREDDEWPFYYKNAFRFFSVALNSKDVKLRSEVADAYDIIFTLNYYGDIDYYIEVLRLWDKAMTYGLFVFENIMQGFIFTKNLQAKLKRKILVEDTEKIKRFLRKADSFVHMSELLYDFVHPLEGEASQLTIDKSVIKDIQLSYFMKYAKKEKVDDDCLKLFVLCADIEFDSRKYLWNKDASEKLRELVDIDPQGYISRFAVKDAKYTYPPKLWKAIFEENPQKVEEYLYTSDKDVFIGINEARKVWKLYENSGYRDILMND